MRHQFSPPNRPFAHGRCWMILRAAGIALLSTFLSAPIAAFIGPTAQASAVFDQHCAALDRRLAWQHRTPETFIALSAEESSRLRRGEFVIEALTPKDADASGAMLHHWRGSAFVPGAHAKDFERLLRDVGSYPRIYAPQVVTARALATSTLDSGAHHSHIALRLRQQKVLTVVLDTEYEIDHLRPSATLGYTVSRSTRVAEVASPSTASEHALTDHDAHGFLWRLRSDWSYAEADGGLYLQLETVSLTRDVPHGLGWLIGPFVQSIPRESLEFTLRASCNALRAAQADAKANRERNPR